MQNRCCEEEAGACASGVDSKGGLWLLRDVGNGLGSWDTYISCVCLLNGASVKKLNKLTFKLSSWSVRINCLLRCRSSSFGAVVSGCLQTHADTTAEVTHTLYHFKFVFTTIRERDFSDENSGTQFSVKEWCHGNFLGCVTMEYMATAFKCLK